MASDVDSAVIKPSFTTLDQMADQINQPPDARYTIAATPIPMEQRIQPGPSERRARAVVVPISKGELGQLSVLGRAKPAPSPEQHRGGKAQNRRVEIYQSCQHGAV